MPNGRVTLNRGLYFLGLGAAIMTTGSVIVAARHTADIAAVTIVAIPITTIRASTQRLVQMDAIHRPTNGKIQDAIKVGTILLTLFNDEPLFNF